MTPVPATATVVAGSNFRLEAEEVKIRTRVAERATPVAAVIAVLSTLSCCLPLTFLGALGLAGASVRVQSLRPWLLVGAVVLLGVGFIQLYVRRNQCQKRSPLSIALFWGAAVIVLLVILFPQVIASLIAG
jgi:cytochrome bd-type quinol oxidase subunit 2